MLIESDSHALGLSKFMSFATAASIPVIFCTEYHSLVNVARLYHGQSILIHAAAGGVGQAAIMLAQILGAEVFATVGSKRNEEFPKETYGLADDIPFLVGIQRLADIYAMPPAITASTWC